MWKSKIHRFAPTRARDRVSENRGSISSLAPASPRPPDPAPLSLLPPYLSSPSLRERRAASAERRVRRPSAEAAGASGSGAAANMRRRGGDDDCERRRARRLRSGGMLTKLRTASVRAHRRLCICTSLVHCHLLSCRLGSILQCHLLSSVLQCTFLVCYLKETEA